MKLYCVYGVIDWEGEYNHTYFLNEVDAEEFKLLWNNNKGYMDERRLSSQETVGEYGHLIPSHELLDMVDEVNK